MTDMTTDAILSGHRADQRVRLMSDESRRLVGVVNLGVGITGLVALIAAYGLTEQLVTAQEAARAGTVARQKIVWIGPDVLISLNMSLLIVGAAAGAVGSAIQQSIVFALRAGYESLERGYVWWYVLRPMWSALLGAVVVFAVSAGLVSIGDTTTSTAGVTVLVTAGAMAGLFTDQALQRLQLLLGATHPATPATETKIPKKAK